MYLRNFLLPYLAYKMIEIIDKDKADAIATIKI